MQGTREGSGDLLGGAGLTGARSAEWNGDSQAWNVTSSRRPVLQAEIRMWACRNVRRKNSTEPGRWGRERYGLVGKQSVSGWATRSKARYSQRDRKKGGRSGEALNEDGETIRRYRLKSEPGDDRGVSRCVSH